MAKSHSATSRACSSRHAGPLTETQLVDVRRAVDRVRGLGVRSIKVHGVLVFLETKERSSGKLPTPPSRAPTAGDGEGAATTRTPDADLSSKQRRSRQRLEKHIAENAARAVQRPPQPQAGREQAMTPGARLRAFASKALPSPPAPTPATPSKSPQAPAPTTTRAPAGHPVRAHGTPAASSSGPGGAPRVAAVGKGGTRGARRCRRTTSSAGTRRWAAASSTTTIATRGRRYRTTSCRCGCREICPRGAQGEGEQGVFGWKRGARRGRRRCEREARAIARRWGGRTLRVLNFSSCVRATTLANPSFCLRSG